MSNIGDKERLTQNCVVKLFKEQLDYEYLGNWEEQTNNSNIEEKHLYNYLKGKADYPDNLIERAIFKFKKVANDQTRSLYDLNKDVYSLLRYGVNVEQGKGKNTINVQFINWNEPLKNNFAIAEEVTLRGVNTKRPDIVLYINGIAIGVLELKKASVSVEEGIRQCIGNQQHYFIKPFFTTLQLVMAGNESEGLRYGVTGSDSQFFIKWKEDTFKEVNNMLHRHLLQLCSKERIVEIIHDFILFDGGKKKICRPHQYFGVKETQQYIKRSEGGFIWHTQGSGKSLTMVLLAKWIKEYNSKSRILIITDRTELDEQIKNVFVDTGQKIVRATSGGDLLEKLNQFTPQNICTLIHKFRNKKGEEETDYNSFIAELKSKMPKDFSPKGDIYVYVDECHRTQSGKLHRAMKEILGDSAIFIGFTGTPLLRTEKQTTLEIFGKRIHAYRFDEAVEDKVILDLRYEARNVDQYIVSQGSIDNYFNSLTVNLPDYSVARLKERWGTMQKLLSSKNRLEWIVFDIAKDFTKKDPLINGYGNAILISDDIYNACKYYELFQETPELKGHCAIVTSYTPNIADLKLESTSDASATEKIYKYEVYEKMLEGKDVKDFEVETKKQFIEQPAQMKLVIVVDKLLTGFDAPPATYLYIDKKMRDHGLFQAICRVNRIGNDARKEYGYIVDYKDLFNSLQGAVSDYTSDAFEKFEKKDIEGLVKNRLKMGKEQLEDSLEAIRELCEDVPQPKEFEDYMHYFCGNSEMKEELKNTEQERHTLYKCASALTRAYTNIATDMLELGYSLPQIESIKAEVKKYEELRLSVMHRSGEYLELKNYEAQMRRMMDMYIGANEAEKISAFDDFSLVDLLVSEGEKGLNKLPLSIRNNKQAMAETIENNLRKLIIQEMPLNPIYYTSMSKLLEELIRLRIEDSQNYQEYLQRILELTKLIRNPEGYPSSIDTKGKQALYDVLEKNLENTLILDNELQLKKPDNWKNQNVPGKQRVVKNIISETLKSFGKVNDIEIQKIYELVFVQSEY